MDNPLRDPTAILETDANDPVQREALADVDAELPEPGRDLPMVPESDLVAIDGVAYTSDISLKYLREACVSTASCLEMIVSPRTA